jgi:hypothetical protein
MNLRRPLLSRGNCMRGRFLDAPKYLTHFSIWKDFAVKMCMGETYKYFGKLNGGHTAKVLTFPMTSPMLCSLALIGYMIRIFIFTAAIKT